MILHDKLALALSIKDADETSASSFSLCPKILKVLSKIDDWHFDSFELDEVTSGRPLSTLGFAIMTKCDLVPGR